MSNKKETWKVRLLSHHLPEVGFSKTWTSSMYCLGQGYWTNLANRSGKQKASSLNLCTLVICRFQHLSSAHTYMYCLFRFYNCWVIIYMVKMLCVDESSATNFIFGYWTWSKLLNVGVSNKIKLLAEFVEHMNSSDWWGQGCWTKQSRMLGKEVQVIHYLVLLVDWQATLRWTLGYNEPFVLPQQKQGGTRRNHFRWKATRPFVG